jgi:tartrate-resistant acid phosphatase type 5
MLKNIRPTVWVALSSIVLTLGLSGWYFQHPIRSEIRRLTLPKVEVAPKGAVRFAVIGDYGSGSYDEGDVAQLIESWTPEFIVTVGDNNYVEGGVEALDQTIGRFYHSYISPYKGKYGQGSASNRFFPIPGHRDWDIGALQPYLDYFTLPGNERYYDFVRGSVHFFMLDTDEREPDGATADSIQGQWLQRRLAESKAPWKLVFAHHAPYTSHRVPDVERMRWPFKAWGADAVLSGYYHVYERLSVDGIPYLVNGAGGTWTSFFGDIDAHSQFRYREDLGALLIDATNTQITFRFVNRDGHLVDHFVLTKNQTKAKSNVSLSEGGSLG